MTIIKRKPASRTTYDWSLLAEACIQEPFVWMCETGERPKTTPHSIRRGSPVEFDPPGSFEAIVQKDGLYVRYVGAPLEYWYPWQERNLRTVARTLDPERFPDEVPANIRDRAELLTPEGLVDMSSEAIAKKIAGGERTRIVSIGADARPAKVKKAKKSLDT